jgi:hypothetical protein
MSHEEIALGLGISRPTLEKYFEAELSTGAYAKRLEVLAAMHGAALKGNVAAQKAYLALEPGLAAPPAEKTAEPLGKKEQQNKDAVTAAAGTDWADLLPKHGTPPNTLQ